MREQALEGSTEEAKSLHHGGKDARWAAHGMRRADSAEKAAKAEEDTQAGA